MADVTENATPNAEPEALAPSWMKRYTPIRNEDDEPGFGETLGAAFQRENLAYNVLDSLSSEKPDDIDPDYDFQVHKKDLLDGLPQDFHTSIALEPSLAGAQYERGRAIEDLENHKIISDSGFTGITASLIAGLASPENFVPWTAAASWVNRASRLKNGLRLGAVTAGVSGGSEAILAADDYTKGGEEILYAASFGFVLGGGIGAIMKPKVRAPDEAPSATVTGQASEAPTPDAPRASQTDVMNPSNIAGPPSPKAVSRDALVSTGLRAERRSGPIEVSARLEAEEVINSFPNLKTLSNAKKPRAKQDVAQAVSRLDPEANVGSDVAAKLDEAYSFAGLEPRGTKTVTVEDRVAGTWDELQADMKAASSKLRDDLDTKLVDDIVRASNDGDDSVGAMRNRSYEPQIVDTSGTEDDILEAAGEWAQANRIKERLDADPTNRAAVLNKITASDFTRLINHPSDVVKRIASDLLEGGTGTLGRSNTASMYKDMYEKRILSLGVIPLNENFSMWAKSAGHKWYKRSYHTTARDDFDLQVRQVLESRTTGETPRNTNVYIIEAADRWDDMMEEALTIGRKSGWEAMQDIPSRKGYVPLVWKGERILQLGSRPATKLISKGYQSVDIPKEVADEIAAAVVKRALDGMAGVDTNIAGLLAKDARGQLRTALSRMGIDDAQINGMMRVLDAKEASAGPAFTKGRTKINLNITSGDKSLLDLVDNDLNSIASKYARDVAGRSAMAKKGFTNDGIWNRWKSAAMKDNARVKGLKGGDDNLSEHLDDIKSYFTATPIAGGINKNARRFQQMTTVNLLGMVGAAQLAEVGTVVARLGLKSAAKNMPAVDEVVTLARKVKRGRNDVIDELRPLLGDFDYDHLLYRPDIVIDDKISGAVDLATFGKIVDKGLGKASVMLGYASGMNTVRHFEHRMAAKMMINKFADLAVNPEQLAKSAARMEDIGIDAVYLDKIIKQINKGVANGDTVFDAKGTLTKLGIQKWPEDVAEQFAIGINRHTAQVVQRQLAGETSNWMHKTVGSLLTQFRHFPIVAFEKQLLRNLRHHDQASISTMLYGFAVSYGVQSIKAGLTSDERTQEDLIKQTVNYMGMMSILPEIGTMANQLGLAPDVLNTRKMGHTGARVNEFDIIDFIPAAGAINTMFKAASLPSKVVSGTATNADIRGSVMAVPFSTTIFTKALMEFMLED